MDHNINEIRRLLALYYEGGLTASEEARLGEMLASATDLPADLEPDRRLFAAISAASERMLPTDEETLNLERRIDLAISVERAREQKARRLKVAGWCSAAAVAALAVSFALRPGISPEGGMVSSGHSALTAAVGHGATFDSNTRLSAIESVNLQGDAVAKSAPGLTERDNTSKKTFAKAKLYNKRGVKSVDNVSALLAEVRREMPTKEPLQEQSDSARHWERMVAAAGNCRIITDTLEIYRIADGVFDALVADFSDANRLMRNVENVIFNSSSHENIQNPL